MHFILGSSSPRRKEILEFFTLPFEQIPSEFDEETIPFEGDPISYANTLALNKAKSIASKYPKACILTADTIVFKEGKVYTKPQNQSAALKILKELADSSHEVYTALTIVYQGKYFTKEECTRVTFHPLTEKQINHYHSVFACDDKAGGYAIQNAGSIIVRKIEGCFYNVMGLPITTLTLLLKKIGVDLWDYLR